MAWQRLVPIRATPKGDGSLTITKSGDVTLPGHLMDELGQPTRITVQYDPDTRCLGLVPAAAEEADTFRLSRKRNRGYVSVGKVLKTHGVSVEAGPYFPRRDGTMLVVGPINHTPGAREVMAITRQAVGRRPTDWRRDA